MNRILTMILCVTLLFTAISVNVNSASLEHTYANPSSGVVFTLSGATCTYWS